jgi:NAD(P)-dependent dehydrogenase (short-subunit alcohol dehydrogenase family)
MDLKGKTIILTGAARIGEDVAQTLLDLGANLALVYRTTKPNKQTGVFPIQAELSDANQAKRAVEEAKKHFGSIFGLVHMAATYEKVPWDNLDEQAWQRSMDAIAKSAFLMSKLSADEMRTNPDQVKGKIILISDWSVLQKPYKDYLPYNVSKSAIVGLTKSLAKELAPDILVNAIAPGPIIRPPDLSDEENEEALSSTPLKRWGGGEEIAKTVKFLMDSDFVTGQVINVDGGRSIA